MYGALDEVKDYCEIGIYFLQDYLFIIQDFIFLWNLKSFQVDSYMFIIIMFICLLSSDFTVAVASP